MIIKKLIAPLLVVAFLGLAVTGFSCASTRDAVAARPAAAKLVVQYATLKLADTPVKADRVLAVVEQLDAIIPVEEAAAPVNVEGFRALVESVVPWQNLDPADQLLVRSLIEISAEELRARIPVGSVDSVPIGDVKTVLGWVRDAAKLAAAQ